MVSKVSDRIGEQPLTPTAFLDRSAKAFADEVAVVDGDVTMTYRELHESCLRMSGYLRDVGVRPGDRVAVLAPNARLLLRAHYAVPYAGAVLVALNTRLNADELRHVLAHSGSKVLLVDESLAETGQESIGGLTDPPMLIVGNDPFESALRSAEPHRIPVEDERGLLAINYTRGTTGRPKGVRYNHRGAYLQSLAMAQHLKLDGDTRYLWTLPMFHCNGWCFTWAVTAAVGTHVCLPKVPPMQFGRSSKTRESLTCVRHRRS